MLDSASRPPPIVFLHIPKTAGQTVHNELARAVGARDVSPIRVHTQAASAEDQFPAGYSLYSGHVDWTALDQIPRPRFVFSILRDPRERIASFYFYLLKEAKALDRGALAAPQNSGKRIILESSADDYFFGGDAAWQAFIQDHYDNFYCRYFGTRRIRAGQGFGEMPERRKLRGALRNMSKIDWVYSLENLTALEDDLKALYSFDLDFTGTHSNVGDRPVSEPRWPRLLALLESDASKQRLHDFVTLDLSLMERLEL
ncbi:MAG: sulfotransferase family 2 domain-containing protein [Planktotalea sp.]|uniref:sulfotransferase family 2 domain-containing protein n=1 Tax=Planktotalea sp. TaxID=2029877 RepID=UPI003C70661E